ncbi:MAG TPA: glycosyltransferase, partial [Anaerolineales bacterium]|nr:glycosyltransferase [Anaerolineales bacterium]
LSRSYGKFPNIKFLSRATVVILSSTVDQIFPLTVVKAFAFGKPVIASNVGGLPEIARILEWHAC